MLLLKICFLSSLILFCCAESETELKNEPSPDVLGENTFETAHKIHRPDEEFQTSHKIASLPKAQYVKAEIEDADTASSLMQLQQTQNLLSTKERPELNPILSALINEDVMKSIEAKRAIEQEQLDAISDVTESPPIVLTTIKPDKVDLSLDDDLNSGLIDQPINLDVAGSENNQKSRIQVKKGPNGMDYEYEYVYYYYDDDEAGGKKQQEAKSNAVEDSSKKDSQPLERGKSRYTNIERSTTSAPDNVLVSGKAKGRASITEASEDVDEGRLPVMTRFPSRGKQVDVQPAALSEPLENTASASNEKSKKISVKRPSLELVDSETFNTDEKQVKGSPRNGDSEKPAPVAASEATKSDEEKVTDAEKPEQKPEEESPSADEVDQTTPLMEKAALDLYAILANENLEMDMTTDFDKDLTTDLPDTTESDEDATTIINEDAETAIPTTASTTTTTTTTTTEAPTTTTTTTTTTTAAPSLFGSGRRGLATAGKNRFRLKSGGAATTSSTSEAAPTAASEPETTVGLKGRNRFQRPSFGNRNRAAPAATPSTAPAEEEVIVKEEEKPVASSPPLRGRTRNRFNIRGQASTSTTTAEPGQGQEQNDEENQVSSTTARTLRGRPTLNIRGRSRPGARPTASTQTPAAEEDAHAADSAAKPESGEEKLTSSSVPTRPSRFNLNRVGGGGAAGGNRLLPRARLNPLRTTSSTSATVESADESSNDVKDESDTDNDPAGKSESETTTTAPAVGGLNRLKTRPRLQLQSKTESKPKASPIPVRKANPLLARRKLALGPSTTESVAAAEEPSEDSAEHAPSTSDDSDKKDADSNQTSTDEAASADDNTDAPETTTKQARGLGLLAQRRRLPMRKPGTLL